MSITKTDKKGREYRIEIDFHDAPKMTFRQVMSFIEKSRCEHPDRSYWMSGDDYAIVSAKRRLANGQL